MWPHPWERSIPRARSVSCCVPVRACNNGMTQELGAVQYHCVQTGRFDQFEPLSARCSQRNAMAPLKLGYWNIRAFAEPIRNLLRYKGVPFQEVVYRFGPPPEYNRNNWYLEKFTLGLDFPNLPYLIDGDLKITQSHAILRYLARKYNLSAECDPAKAKEDMLEYQLADVRLRLFKALYYKTFNSDDEFRADLQLVKQDLDVQLAQFEKYIQGRQWLTGDHLSYVDFLAYEIFDWHREMVDRNCLSEFAQMSAFMARFENLEPLKQYLASDQYRKGHLLGPIARIGFRKEREVEFNKKQIQ